MALELEFLVKDGASVKINQLKKELGLLDPKIKETDRSMVGLNSSMAKLAVGYISLQGAMNIGKSFIAQADSIKLINSQLKLVTKSTIELTQVQQDLFKLSQESRQGYSETVNLYARMARATKDLGTSQEDLLTVTETINKALIISGSTTAEASSTMIQLSQALASGVLRGEEFNSVTENGSRVAMALSDSLGVSIGTLRDMAKEGKLTSDIVIKALKDQAGSVNKEFDIMEKTVSQSMKVASNSVTKLVGDFDSATGATSSLSDEISNFSKYLDQNSADIIDFGEDIIAGGTIVANGLKSIYLVSKSGYVQLTLALKEEIEIGLNGVIDITESALNTIIDTINETKQYWGELLDIDVDSIPKVDFGDIVIGSEDLRKSIKDINVELLNLSKSTDKAFLEIATNSVEIKQGASSDGKNEEKKKKAVEELTKAQQKQLDLEAKLNSQYLSIIGTDYDKWLENTNQTMIKLGQSTTLTAEELQKAYDVLSEGSPDNIAQKELEIQMEQAKADLILAGFETIKSEQDLVNEKYLDMYDAVQGIFDETQMTTFFDKWNKELKGVEKQQKGYEGIGSSDWTSGLKGQYKAIGNIGNAFNDVAKEQKNWNKFSEENVATEEDKQKHLSAQLGTYGNLAGAIGSMYEEGSSGAKAALIAQQALAIVEGGLAVVHQMTSGDVYTAIPRAIAVAAMVAQAIGGSSSGGGGGGSVTSGTVRSEEYYDNAKEIAEDTNKPILAKFDRQIELLEQISGYGGTTIGLGLEKALAQYTADSTIAIIEASAQGTSLQQDWYGRSWQQYLHDRLNSNTQSIINQLGEFSDNVDYWVKYTWAGDYVNRYQSWTGIDETSFSGASEFVEMLEYMKSNNLLEAFGYTQLEYENIISDFQDISAELAITVLENINTLIDYSDELESLFDTITNTTKYQMADLNQAFADVNELSGSQSVADYLESQIQAITDLENSLTKTQISLLLSSNINDYEAQQLLITQIQSETLATLDTGVLEALNYKDAIILVGEAMATSSENIKSWEDSFKTDDELALDMANSLGVVLATTEDELTSLFNLLSGGLGGLTDVELELLEANKDLIGSFDDLISGMIDSIDQAIATIKGNTLTQDEFTDDEIKRLNATQRAFETSLAGNDTDKAQELLSEITSLSTSISGSAFGDTSLLNANLITELEASKALIDFQDEILMVHIVGSDLTEPIVSNITTPSVTVSNPSNDSDRLDNIEAIMTQVLITNKNVYDILLRIENDGLRTI